MDFDLSEDQRMLQDGVERLLAEQYSFEQRKTVLGSPLGYSEAMWRRYAELGLLALPFSETDGGLGGGAVDTMLVMEMFGRHLVLEPFLATVILGGGCLRHGGSAEQRRSVLPELLSGQRTLALAHVERAARYELAHIATRARRAGTDWVLDGAKAVVLGGDSARLLVVSARDTGEVASEDGIGLYLVDSAAHGVTRRGYPTQDGTRAADIQLDDVRVSGDCRLAAPRGALPVLRRVIDEALAALCAEAVGVMTRAHEQTVEYLKQRRQFGVVIGSFQALQHRAVDMLVMIEQARSMMLYATMMVDTDDAAARGRAVSAAKVQIGRSGKFVGEQAVQLHGGIGVTEECQVGHYYRRLTMIEILFGDSAHHLAVLARAGGLPE